MSSRAAGILGVVAPLCAAVAVSSTLTSQPRAQGVVDRLAAVVGTKRIITQSDVDLAARLTLAREGQLAQLRGEVPAALRRRVLQQLIVLTLVHEEATAFGFTQTAEEDVDAKLAATRGKFPEPRAWLAFLVENEVTERDVRELFRRELVARRFGADQVRLNVRVTDEQVKDWLLRERTHPELTGKTPEAQREVALRILAQGALEKERQRWIAELRKRVRVRVLVNYR